MCKPEKKMNKEVFYTTIEDYIVAQPEAAQETLIYLWENIRANVPEGTEEGINYQLPAFKHRGKPLIYFGGFKKHVSLFPTKSPIAVFKEELEPYKTSQGAINMPFGHRFPVDLLKKLIDFRKEAIDFEAENKIKKKNS
jgi:uncharacterized protein YdhG (YjbR/CyaY superfamily)